MTALELTHDGASLAQELEQLERSYKAFGNNLPHLREIKKKYDPSDLFLVAKGVGSEDWDDSLNCRK